MSSNVPSNLASLPSEPANPTRNLSEASLEPWILESSPSAERSATSGSEADIDESCFDYSDFDASVLRSTGYESFPLSPPRTATTGGSDADIDSSDLSGPTTDPVVPDPEDGHIDDSIDGHEADVDEAGNVLERWRSRLRVPRHAWVSYGQGRTEYGVVEVTPHPRGPEVDDTEGDDTNNQESARNRDERRESPPPRSIYECITGARRSSSSDGGLGPAQRSEVLNADRTKALFKVRHFAVKERHDWEFVEMREGVEVRRGRYEVGAKGWLRVCA
ncbi:MAG: hypothetical protein Q9181_005055 [Wetmoreana brouardii]